MAFTLGWLFLISLASSSLAQWPPQLIGPPNGHYPPLPIGTLAPPPTLTQDLEPLQLLVQWKQLKQLAVRYLINDAQFQAFVRIINSNDAVTARWRLLSQPELILFLQWVDQQLLASGGGWEMEEQELKVPLLNRFPYWSGTVYGWQGFLNEAQLYVPIYAIRSHIDAKLMQPGIFSQFWSRVQGLRVVYDRWVALAEVSRLLTQLQNAGIDTVQLDVGIRQFFGWNVVNITTTPAPASLPAPTRIPGAVVPPNNSNTVTV